MMTRSVGVGGWVGEPTSRRDHAAAELEPRRRCGGGSRRPHLLAVILSAVDRVLMGAALKFHSVDPFWSDTCRSMIGPHRDRGPLRARALFDLAHGVLPSVEVELRGAVVARLHSVLFLVPASTMLVSLLRSRLGGSADHDLVAVGARETNYHECSKHCN